MSGKRWLGFALVVLGALFGVLAWAPPAFAQQLDLVANVDANEIELGDTITYTLQATSSTSDAPSDPRLAGHPGFTIVDHGSAPSHMVSIINGRASERRGLTASWTLRADKLGTFTIGPGSVAIGATRRTAQAQQVRVLAPGQGRPKPRRPRGFDPFGGGGAGSPFDPFKGIFPGVDDESESIPTIRTDPKLGLDVPRSPVAFLHASVDKTHAVVGEQIVLTVYLYEDLHQRQGRPSDVHEATANDFVKRSLLADETRATHVGDALVGGKPWSVKLVRKSALFPIKSGRLSIAPMSLTLPQARVGLRESETLWVEVTEPPIAGRPAGYQVGDTGDFSLSANVTPKSVDQHGAVGVTVELRGNGNMPSTLPTPEVGGVEWLEPQTRDNLGAVANERFGGSRTFSYVVRVHREGAVDLGEIRLPFWDPQARVYNVARAALGIVQVARASGRDAGTEVAETLLPNLPTARGALEGRKTETFVTERPAYWGALFGSPLACALTIVIAGSVRRLRERRAAAAPSPDRIAKERRADAETAVKGADGTAAVAAIARALETSVLASTGVNVRGASSEHTRSELVEVGVAEAAADELLDVIRACEDARFSPSGVPIAEAHALWDRAKSALAALGSSSSRAAE